MMINQKTSLLPARWQILNGSWLKVIAMAAMVIDHTASHILRHYPPFIEPLYTVGHTEVSLVYLMRCVGRLAFPLFCFLLVEGFLHTRDRGKSGRNLLLFALMSEIPWNLSHGGHVYGWSQNVIFTLFLGFLALCVVNRWEQQRIGNRQLALRLFAIIALSILSNADYGSCGIPFILLLYVLRHNRILQAATGCTMLGMRWIAGLAFIPMNMYNGQRGFIQGPLAKYAFYAFYPLHLLALWLTKQMLFR